MDLASNAFTVVGPATLAPNAVITGQVKSANATALGHGSAPGAAEFQRLPFSLVQLLGTAVQIVQFPSQSAFSGTK